MNTRSFTTLRRTALFATVALAVTTPAAAQARLTLPAGSVILVHTTSALESANAKAGQTFETTIDENVSVDGMSIIPSGSRIRGVVSVATAATRQQSGVIEVVFDRITFPDGSATPITGRLTSTDSAERRQIDSDPNARVALVGGRGGIGAAIAGAGSSRGTSSLLSALGSMLSEGQNVSVPSGTALAVKLDRAVSLRTRGRISGTDGSVIYTAPDRIRSAQEALRRLNYYRGSVNGTTNDATRRALFQFQVDKGLNATGNLDARTAQALGLDLGNSASGSTASAGLSAAQASIVRRDADALVSRLRADAGISSAGRLDASRNYAQADLELWFAQSAFADNAALYEQVVRSGGNANATMLAGRSLVNAARRVEAAMQEARTTGQFQSMWTALRRQLSPLESQ